MRKWILPSLVLVALCAASCNRDCMDTTDVRVYTMTQQLDAWSSDSILLPFDMRRSDGVGDHFDYRSGYRNEKIVGVSCQASPDIRTEREYKAFRHESTLMQRECYFQLEANSQGQILSVGLGEFGGSYNVETGAFLSSSTTEGIITCTGSILDSLDVQGRVWHDVINLRTTAGFVDIQEVWLASGWGLIRYRETNGLIWDRLP